MKYLIIEIQTFKDGNVVTLVTQKDDLNEAMSTYYSILAAAAISSLPVHAATLLINDGRQLKFDEFEHKESEVEE